MSAEAETEILDKAWRAIDALGGTHEPNQADYGRGYDEALSLAIAEVEKLGGMDPGIRQRERLEGAAPELLDALKELVWVINIAGLHHLANGVQAGSTSWAVKASDRLVAAEVAIAKATVPAA